MIESPHMQKLLVHHQYQGKTNDCGPVCMAIILNAINASSIDGLELGQKLNKIELKNGLPRIYRIKDWIMFPWGIISHFRQSGLHARIRVGKKIDWVHQQLEYRKILIPILGRWNPLWAHYLIPVAWEKGIRIGFCNPAKKSNNIDWMKEIDFKKFWRWSFNAVIEITI